MARFSRGYPESARQSAREQIKRRVAAHDAAVLPRILDLLNGGLSANAIAKVLNVDRVPSPATVFGGMDGNWTAKGVSRILDRHMGDTKSLLDADQPADETTPNDLPTGGS